jgi:hypothetical protein
MCYQCGYKNHATHRKETRSIVSTQSMIQEYTNNVQQAFSSIRLQMEQYEKSLSELSSNNTCAASSFLRLQG